MPITTTINNGGTSGGGSLADLLKQYQQANDKANSANQSRYDQGLGRLTNAYNLVNSTGQTAINNINRQKTMDQASAQSGLIGRGLGNSTVVNSVNNGITRTANDAITAANESKNRQLSDISQSQAAFIAGRNDSAPDGGLLAQLIQQSSAAQQLEQQPKPTIRVQRGSINDPIQFGSTSLGGIFG